MLQENDFEKNESESPSLFFLLERIEGGFDSKIFDEKDKIYQRVPSMKSSGDIIRYFGIDGFSNKNGKYKSLRKEDGYSFDGPRYIHNDWLLGSEIRMGHGGIEEYSSILKGDLVGRLNDGISFESLQKYFFKTVLVFYNVESNEFIVKTSDNSPRYYSVNFSGPLYLIKNLKRVEIGQIPDVELESQKKSLPEHIEFYPGGIKVFSMPEINVTNVESASNDRFGNVYYIQDGNLFVSNFHPQDPRKSTKEKFELPQTGYINSYTIHGDVLVLSISVNSEKEKSEEGRLSQNKF